ncbi:MAG: hypothetical protein VR72_10200 [Clostridiaceae bacterium BRH_c20a]|nr:MAG: hypothetical protein VR72_10200 [Clostridiaceae bacterium BRH_c20a]
MKEKVVAVNKDPDGNILSVKTDKGRVYRLEQAVMQVESGNLAGIQVIDRNGRQYLRTYPDQVAENNLDNLPEF